MGIGLGIYMGRCEYGHGYSTRRTGASMGLRVGISLDIGVGMNMGMGIGINI
ncbi:hypothetical protein LOAG_15863, partial [Loa loa]